jgi:TolB-like protein/Flp pilus assembly protein TadD
MGDDERATMDTLDELRGVFKEQVEANQGRVVDMAGDSVLAVFETAIGAVEAAVATQGELAERNEGLPEARHMRFRVGVNLGDIYEKDDGAIYGDGVNVAARLESLAEPGGLTISGTTFDHVDGKLDIGFEYLGEREVKNIAKPVRVYRAELGAGHTRVQPSAAMTEHERPSIAVLAFENLSGDVEQEYFADGVAEDLITELSRLRWLRVTARNSTFTYKGQAVDVKQVGRDLGVRYVVEGSVRRAGDRVRISAQLIDATSGNHVWAERYDRDLEDIFAVQDEITDTIVAAIEPELGEVERERARRKRPENLDAWGNYQLGLSNMYRFTKESNAEARRLFERAIDFDRSFAAAFAGLAYTHLMDTAFGYVDTRDPSLEQALSAAETAIALDEKDAFAHCVLGRVFTYLGKGNAAIEEVRTAIELTPSLALAHYVMGQAMMAVGRPQESIDATDEAARLSPHDPFLWLFDMTRGHAYNLMGDHERAIEWIERASRRPRKIEFWISAILASSLGHLGRYEEARDALDKARQSEPRFSYAFIKRNLPFGRHEHFKSWFEGLRKAGLDIPDEPTATD